MKAVRVVKQRQEVEICDRCQTRPATQRFYWGYTAADIEALGVTKAMVVCDACAGIIDKARTQARRPRKAANG